MSAIESPSEGRYLDTRAYLSTMSATEMFGPARPVKSAWMDDATFFKIAAITVLVIAIIAAIVIFSKNYNYI